MKLQAYQIEEEAMPRTVTRRVALLDRINPATARRYKERPSSADFPLGVGAAGPIERCDRHLAALQAVNPTGSAIALQYLIEQHESRALGSIKEPFIEVLPRLLDTTFAMLRGLMMDLPLDQKELLMLRTTTTISLALGAMNDLPNRKANYFEVKR